MWPKDHWKYAKCNLLWLDVLVNDVFPFILPDKKESVHGKCCVAHRLEHKVPLSQCSQRFVFYTIISNQSIIILTFGILV